MNNVRAFARLRFVACLSIACAALTVQAGTFLISNTSPVRVHVPTNDIGESWRTGVPFDDSGWVLGTNGVGYETVAGHPGKIIADSVFEWSSAGVQGLNRWINGYYDKTADTNGTYNLNDFQPFPRTYGGVWSSSNFWDGGSWNWNPDFVPWDNIGQTAVHPNGTNSGNIEHWVMRRWHSTYSGPVTLQFHTRKSNASGNGVTGKIFHNGAEVYSQTIPGNDLSGFNAYVNVTIAEGDVLDFANTPLGSDGNGNDGSDGSEMTARVYAGTFSPPTPVADSVTEFSGTQGQNNWFYGYYDRGGDGDATYSAAEFNSTDPNWTFTGNWELGPGNPPWDTIGATTWHPNGPSPRHWVIRRWVSEITGAAHAQIRFAKQGLCGNGVTVRVFVNGAQAAAYTIGGVDSVGVNATLNLPLLTVGDLVDFALDSVGTDGDPQDGCDSTSFAATVATGAPFAPGFADSINTDLTTLMRGSNSSVFLRYPFTATNLADIDSLTMRLKWNDGMEVRLNGKAVVAANAPTVLVGVTNADSIAQWSTTGTQGENGWRNGYYNASADGNGTYESEDFTEFPHDGGGYSATDFWTGSFWDWFAGNPPWLELGQEGTHPSSPNGAAYVPGTPSTYELWPVRRWVVNADGDYSVRFRFRKTNPNCGDGIIGKIFHNGVLVYSNSIAGTDAVGRDDVITITNVFIDDVLDFAIAPGVNDFCDGSAFSATVFSGVLRVPWNAVATATRAKSVSVVPQVISMNAYIADLIEGTNVLAIQGIADAVSADDFLIAPELIVNQGPQASNDVITAQQDIPMMISAASLLANDTDADGDGLLLVGVTPNYTTAAGGSVRLYGNTVRYVPPAGYAGPDSFDYVVNDAEVVSTATVNINVSNRRITRIEPLGNGTVKVTVENVAPGVALRLERTGVLPATTWDSVAGPQTPNGSGVVELIDLNPLANGAFYRTVTP